MIRRKGPADAALRPQVCCTAGCPARRRRSCACRYRYCLPPPGLSVAAAMVSSGRRAARRHPGSDLIIKAVLKYLLQRLQPQGSEEAKAFVSAFLKRSMPQKKDEAIQDVLTRKAVVLEHHCRRRKQPKRRKTKTFTAKQRRELRLFEIEPEQQRQEHELVLSVQRAVPTVNTAALHHSTAVTWAARLINIPDPFCFLTTTTCDSSSNPPADCNQKISILHRVP